MTQKQIINLSRVARYLLTDLEQVLGVSCTEAQEQQAIQLITDAITDNAPLVLGHRFANSREAIDLVFNPDGGDPEVVRRT